MPKYLRPEVAFALVAIVFGSAIAFVTPPLQVPDEPHHWYRIYRLSEGHVVDVHRDPAAAGGFVYGGAVPASLVDCVDRFSPLIGERDRRVPAGAIPEELRRPLAPDVRRDVAFPGAALYSPVAYAPAAVATAVGRSLSLPPVVLLWLGRLATLAAFVAVGFCAIRATPVGKWPAAIVLANPMALFLAASLSADALTIALGLLATALALRHAIAPTPRDDAREGGAMLAVALCKSAYAPIVLMSLAAPMPPGWRGRARRLAIPAVAGLAIVIWSALTHPGGVRLRGDAPNDQLAWVLHHPIDYARILSGTVARNATRYLYSGVGSLGWLETTLSPHFVRGWQVLLLVVTLGFGEAVAIRPRVRLLAISAAVGGAFLVFLANYMVWNKIAALVIEGIQGRYFLPLGLLVIAALHRRGRWQPSPRWLLGAMVVTAAYTIWVLARRYHA